VNLQADIKKGLIDQFRFKKVSGDWLQEGQCPDCGKFEAFCAADEPKIVRCGRQDRCGWEDSVRNLLPDLFEDWSKRHPITEQDPTPPPTPICNTNAASICAICAGPTRRNSTAIRTPARPARPSASPSATPIGNASSIGPVALAKRRISAQAAPTRATVGYRPHHHGAAGQGKGDRLRGRHL
jgi:hypothetical protein